MRSYWLALVLVLVAANARAQQDPLAEPGPVLVEQPYYACPNCAPAPYWDPYEAEIARLQRQRPSRFGPIALMVGGPLAILAGIGGLSEGDEGGYDQLYGAAFIAAGAAMVGLGAVWHVVRNRKRERIDQRIVQLTLNRAAGVPYVYSIEPVAPRPAPVSNPLDLSGLPFAIKW